MNNIYEIFFKDGSVLKIYGDYNIGDGIFRFFEKKDGVERVYMLPIESIKYIVGVNK